jgi:AcrR family transcriptional regulator
MRFFPYTLTMSEPTRDSEPVKSMPNGEINGETAKERLFLAAADLFAEKGYASTSVREIVTRAGVTKPVLYYYFDSKEGLFRAIIDWAAQLQQQVITEALGEPGPVLERLNGFLRRVYRGVYEYQSLFRMIHNLIFGPPQGTPEFDFQPFHRRMVDAINAIYSEGISRHEVKEANADDVALMVLSLLDYCLNLDLAHLVSSDAERPLRMLRLAFEGLRLEPS